MKLYCTIADVNFFLFFVLTLGKREKASPQANAKVKMNRHDKGKSCSRRRWAKKWNIVIFFHKKNDRLGTLREKGIITWDLTRICSKNARKMKFTWFKSIISCLYSTNKLIQFYLDPVSLVLIKKILLRSAKFLCWIKPTNYDHGSRKFYFPCGTF